MTSIDLPDARPTSLGGLRLFYFARYAALGSVIPFLSLFFSRAGQRGVQIGLLTTIGAMTALLAAPLWGRLADGLGRPLRLVQIGVASSVIAYGLLSHQSTFGWFAVMVGLEAIGSSAVNPLSDAFVVRMTGGAQGSFGGVRLWGSLGWAVMVLASGWLIERQGIGVIFFAYALFGIGGVLLLQWLLPDQANPATVTGDSLHLWAVAHDLFQRRAMVGLVAAMVLIDLLGVGVSQFEPLFLDRLGARETLIGLIYTLAALVELPGMMWADWLVRRFGPGRVLRLSLLVGMARSGLVLLWPSVPVIVGSGLLRGIYYAFNIVGLTVLATTQAPRQQEATILALFAVVLPNLSNLLGAAPAGLIFDAWGGRWLYGFMLAGMAAGWLIMRTMVTDNA
jgi:PPP family 3-phenylpropionic acid transporter